MNEKIRSRLVDAYANPKQKFVFFTGKNDVEFGKQVNDHRQSRWLLDRGRRPRSKEGTFSADQFRIDNHWQSQWFGRSINRARWDWTPQETLNIEPWFWNTHTLALAMGCSSHRTSEDKEWVDPLILDPAQVNDLEVPDPLDGRTGEIIETIQELMIDLPEGTQIRLPDIQSPLGVAELMWHPDHFYLALLTHPKEVHLLLDKISKFTISYIQEIQAILGNRLNPACFPEIWSDPAGYYIADDTNSLVSPEMHLDFSVRYINQITEACGPVHYHSCTWKKPYFDNIRKLKNIKAVNWAVNTSDDPADIIKEFSGEFLLCPHIGVDSFKGESVLQHNFANETALVVYVLDNMQENTCLYIWFQPELVQDVEKMLPIYRLLESNGYTPDLD